MQRFTSFFGLTSMLLACGVGSGATEVSNALPQAATVALGSPVSKSGAQSNRIVAGQTSDYYQATYALTTAVNSGVGWVLTLIDEITQTSPSSCDPNQCQWGPGAGALDPNRWQLLVQKTADAPLTYSYLLQAEPKSNSAQGFLTIVSGKSQPSGVPHRGQGSFTIDFDAARQLDQPHADLGTLSATYDNTAALSIGVTFAGSNDAQHPGQRDNAAYQYADAVDGGGSLQAAVHNLSSDDTFSLASRWSADGSGRSDVTGSSAYGNGQASECWNTSFQAEFWSSNPADPNNPPFGDPSAMCGAFPTAQPATITAP